MTNPLVKLFVKDYKDVENENVREKYATVADDRGVLDGCAERARAFYEANLTEERFFDILGYEDVKEKIPIENG